MKAKKINNHPIKTQTKRQTKRRSYRFETPEELKINKLCNRAQYRAKKSGVEFTLFNDPDNPCFPPYQKNCTYCDAEMKYSGGTRQNMWQSVSIDRIDPTKGYTPENICLCCYKCNTRKSNETPESLEELARRIKAIREKHSNAKRE